MYSHRLHSLSSARGRLKQVKQCAPKMSGKCRTGSKWSNNARQKCQENVVLEVNKRSVLRRGSIEIQIKIGKGWCTADTDSKV